LEVIWENGITMVV